MLFRSGISGYSGDSGISGFSGYSGFSGSSGVSSTFYPYLANAVATSGDPSSGHVLWNNATQINATQINVSSLTSDGVNINVFIGLLQNTEEFAIQDQVNSANNQTWLVTGTPTQVGSYWTIPATLISSSGTGTTGFANNLPVIFAVVNGISGFSEIGRAHV